MSTPSMSVMERSEGILESQGNCLPASVLYLSYGYEEAHPAL